MRLVPLRYVSFIQIFRYEAAHVVVGLVGSGNGETKVVGLFGGHLGKLNAELTKVRSGDLLVEGLGEHARFVSFDLSFLSP